MFVSLLIFQSALLVATAKIINDVTTTAETRPTPVKITTTLPPNSTNSTTTLPPNSTDLTTTTAIGCPCDIDYECVNGTCACKKFTEPPCTCSDGYTCIIIIVYCRPECQRHPKTTPKPKPPTPWRPFPYSPRWLLASNEPAIDTSTTTLPPNSTDLTTTTAIGCPCDNDYECVNGTCQCKKFTKPPCTCNDGFICMIIIFKCRPQCQRHPKTTPKPKPPTPRRPPVTPKKCKDVTPSPPPCPICRDGFICMIIIIDCRPTRQCVRPPTPTKPKPTPSRPRPPRSSPRWLLASKEPSTETTTSLTWWPTTSTTLETTTPWWWIQETTTPWTMWAPGVTPSFWSTWPQPPVETTTPWWWILQPAVETIPPAWPPFTMMPSDKPTPVLPPTPSPQVPPKGRGPN